MYFGYEKSIGDPLRVGFIGTGDEGQRAARGHDPQLHPGSGHRRHSPLQRVARLPRRSSSEAPQGPLRPDDQVRLEERGRSSATRQSLSGDYHDLLADPNVEAVVIALPLHLHAPVAIEAMKAGKHVLTEKLMAHNVAQCKEMGRVAQQTGKILAVGHQRHYSILYDNAVDMIRRGLIGDIHHIRAQWHRGNLPGQR